MYVVLLKLPLTEEKCDSVNGTARLSYLMKGASVIGVNMTKASLSIYLLQEEKILINENISGKAL